MSEAQVRNAVVHRLAWIKRHRARLQAEPPPREPEIITGETHLVWGRPRLLRLVEGADRPGVELDEEELILFVPSDATAQLRHAVLDRWRRDQLRHALGELINTWEPRLGVSVPDWIIRSMKTRWGTCNTVTRRLTFNSELAKAHPDCVEYVVVHEMAHYFIHNHGLPFTRFMDGHLPEWRARRRELSAVSLRHEP